MTLNCKPFRNVNFVSLAQPKIESSFTSVEAGMFNIMRLFSNTLHNRISLFNKTFVLNDSSSILRNYCSKRPRNTVSAVLSNGYSFEGYVYVVNSH